jgi:hypothetical protein
VSRRRKRAPLGASSSTARPARPADSRPAPGWLRRLAAAIHGFTTIEIDPFALGLFRVALGAYVLVFYVMLAPSWLFYYGADGILPIAPRSWADYQPLMPLFWFERSDAFMWILLGVSMVSALLFALGILWRVAGLWLWHMNLTLLYSNAYVVNGEEQVLGLLLLFGLFLPLGASFTWRQLRDGRARRELLLGAGKVRVWALKPLQVHLVLVYLLSLPDKLSDPAWTDGTLVYYAMMAVDYARWPGLEIFAWGNAALSRVLTMFSLAVEVLVPALIWFRRFRLPCVLAAVGLHVGMGVMIEGVMMFNAAMCVAMILFLPSRRTREWLAQRLGAPDALGAQPAAPAAED